MKNLFSAKLLAKKIQEEQLKNVSGGYFPIMECWVGGKYAGNCNSEAGCLGWAAHPGFDGCF